MHAHVHGKQTLLAERLPAHLTHMVLGVRVRDVEVPLELCETCEGLPARADDRLALTRVARVGRVADEPVEAS